MIDKISSLTLLSAALFERSNCGNVGLFLIDGYILGVVRWMELSAWLLLRLLCGKTSKWGETKAREDKCLLLRIIFREIHKLWVNWMPRRMMHLTRVGTDGSIFPVNDKGSWHVEFVERENKTEGKWIKRLEEYIIVLTFITTSSITLLFSTVLATNQFSCHSYTF